MSWWKKINNSRRNLHVAKVADMNAASVALLKKLGFSEDRKSRFRKWGEETYFDAHYYKLIIGE